LSEGGVSWLGRWILGGGDVQGMGRGAW